MKRKSISRTHRLRLFALHHGQCHLCHGRIDATREAWEVSHDIPLELGGADDDVNRKPAHAKCHRVQTSTIDIPRIAKAKRREARHLGAKAKSSRPVPGSKASGIRKRMDGTVERRT